MKSKFYFKMTISSFFVDMWFKPKKLYETKTPKSHFVSFYKTSSSVSKIDLKKKKQKNITRDHFVVHHGLSIKVNDLKSLQNNEIH